MTRKESPKNKKADNTKDEVVNIMFDDVHIQVRNLVSKAIKDLVEVNQQIEKSILTNESIESDVVSYFEGMAQVRENCKVIAALAEALN